MIILDPGFCFPNDSIARIGTGGLEFQQNKHISIENENLQISPSKINVSYVFLNNSPKPITALVAFPMPEYGWNPGLSAYDANIGPIYDFSASADGRAIRTENVKRALIDGHDATKELREIGLSEKQIFENWAGYKLNEKMGFSCELSQDQIKRIMKLGKNEADETAFPNWTISETIVWQQTFPPGKMVNVSHSYKPLVGEVYTYYTPEDNVNSFELPSSALSGKIKEACVDRTVKNGIVKQIRATPGGRTYPTMVWLKDVEYILGTGRNWAGPIKKFTLTIKKETKNQLVSTCFPGNPERIDDLTIKFNTNNFVPQDKLVVYYYFIKK